MFRASRATGLLQGGIIVLALVGGCTKKAGDAGSQPVANRAATSENFAVNFSAAVSADASSMPSTLPGRIVGVVKWTGPLPKHDPILVNRDAHVCAGHGKHDRESESLIVNASNGGLKDSVVYLFGKFEDDKPLSELKHPDTLNQQVCSYEPRVFVVPVGARLSITSDDEVGHNVRMTGAADLNIAISRGGRSSRRLEQVGLVKVGCDIHPWMAGYIHVVKHPYYTVTDTDGQFELTDVPPGEQQIKLWHESWWAEDGRIAAPVVSTHTVTVRPGETTTATFDLSDPVAAQMAKNGTGRVAATR